MAQSSSEPMTETAAGPGEVVTFWQQAGPDLWFKKDETFDRQLEDRFLKTHDEASAGALDHWSDDADGSLALILVLDQFSRNLFRNSPRAFAQDHKALAIARRAVERGDDRQFDTDMRCFFYMPFEHSECLGDQHLCVSLVHQLNNDNYLQYAKLHRDIIQRFGRFPHRNVVLGRHTSPAEQAYLDADGFSG